MKPETIRATFRVLETAGLSPPFSSPEESIRASETWAGLLGGLSPVQLQAAVQAHLQSPRGTWWPKPSELLTQARRLPSIRPSSADFSELPYWATLADGERRIRVLDLATRQIREAGRPCGAKEEPCPVDCHVCAIAISVRADELARLDDTFVDMPTQIPALDDEPSTECL